MKIEFTKSNLKINFEWRESIWAFKRSIILPLKDIKRISTEKVDWVWGLRAPGTSVPLYFHAGTFYTKHGKEFWYYRLSKEPLIIEMKGKKPFKRIVLGVEGALEFKSKIQQAIKKL